MIQVEFYGIPRARAGVPAVAVEAGTVGEVCALLFQQFPELARDCLTSSSLQPGYLASVNGVEFTRGPDRELQDGDHLLLFGSDVGG